MSSIRLGIDQRTGKAIYLPVSAFSTHLHMVGTTGAGKTTALLTMLYQLLTDRFEPASHIIVDFLGGLTGELLMWMSSRWCPQRVRDRLVLVEPSREGITLPMNPLLYDTLDHGFFKVNRATELILRAWESQNVQEQPRLGRWLFNSFWACAQLGLTVADTVHLLMPGSPYHQPLLRALPDRLRLEWGEILNVRGNQDALRILDSTRNRMKPFYEAGILRSMFGSVENRFDALRFMRERKIVVLNLAPRGRLTPQVANAIAGLAVNEVLAAARSQPPDVRYPTYLWLDEFQRMVTPDLEFAIPEVRQLGIKLILAHQSFSQLERGDVDLTSLIWLPRTRLMFAENGEDADILGKEIAALMWNPKRVKDEIYSVRQLVTGKKLVELKSWGVSSTDAKQWSETYNWNKSASDSVSRHDGSSETTRAKGTAHGDGGGKGEGGSASQSSTQNTHQQLIDELQTTRELSSRSYYSFQDEQATWASEIRKLQTGSCLLKSVDQAGIIPVKVDETKPGVLGVPVEILHRKHPKVIAAYEALIERNYEQDCFLAASEVERETHERLQRVLMPVVHISSHPSPPTVAQPQVDHFE